MALPGLSQSGEELVPVFVIAKDRLAFLTAVHHVIYRPGITAPEYWMRNLRGMTTGLPISHTQVNRED